jgi:hypothetical protein
MQFDGEYPWQLGTAAEDVFFTIRLTLQDFTAQNDSFFDWFNPIHAFKVENDNNTIRSFDIVNFNDDYVDIKVTFVSKNLNQIDDTFKLYVNPKKGAISPLLDRSIFNLQVDVVLDFPEETNMETNLFNPYNLGTILYREGVGF